MRKRGGFLRAVRFGAMHAALLFGSIVFAAPFIWLLSTSAKVPDEFYPPRWVPEIPLGVVDSPYMDLRFNERPLRPPLVSKEDWERVSIPIRNAMTSKLKELAPQLPAFYVPYVENSDWADAIFSRILKRAPDDLFAKPENEIAAWFSENVSVELAHVAFDSTYRRVALADVKLYGWDLATEAPTDGNHYSWTVTGGDAAIIERPEGLDRPAQELKYSFAKQTSFSIQTVVPMAMKLENLKKILVSNHADRSWHSIWATFEVAGRRFEATQAAFTGTDLWQDTTWQMDSPDDKSIKMKTWLRLGDAGTSDFNEPGKLRVTLEYRYAPHLLAVYNKYTDNYRRAVRTAPIALYMENSFFLVILNVLGQVLGSSLIAYAFARLRWPGRDFCFILVLATLMVPQQVTMIPVFLIFKYLGWYNTLKPLWVTSFFGGAFYIFLLRQFMLGIPRELEDSAKIDGCGYFRIYYSIVLPLIKPALATIGIFTFINVWNDFLGPLIYITDQRLYPLSLGLFALQALLTANFAYGLMMAAAVLMTLPVVILFFSAQRTFIQGVTLTGLKG